MLPLMIVFTIILLLLCSHDGLRCENVICVRACVVKSYTVFYDCFTAAMFA